MTRTMYDSVTVADLPADATLVAGYVDGRYANVAAIRQHFPLARVVTITVLGGDLDANVVDIETGDCTPRSGVRWALRKLAAGKGHPTLYCNLSTWPEVKAEVHAAGLDGKVSYWIAHYDGNTLIPAGAVAVQYDDKGPHGEHYDVSSVAAWWPGVDPPRPAAKRNPHTPPPIPFDAGRRLHYMSRVRWVQWALRRPTTGRLNVGDRAALLEFKRRNGLHVDLIIRRQAHAALAAITRR